MSAEILRRAANAARDEWAGETTGPFKNAARIHLAAARSLSQHAEEHDAYDCNWGDACASLALARAYLGESA